MLSKNSLLYSCLLVLLCVAALTSAAYAQSPDPELEKEAQAIDRMIMCPVCPAETIDQAQVEISFQMRAVIREMLAEGRSREEILDYFVDRYGPDILAAPPKTGANLLAWILPIVGIVAGLGGLFLVIRAMTGRGRTSPAPSAASGPTTAPSEASATDPELAPYLEMADRLLASRRASFAGQVSAVPSPPVSITGQELSQPITSSDTDDGSSGSHG